MPACTLRLRHRPRRLIYLNGNRPAISTSQLQMQMVNEKRRQNDALPAMATAIYLIIEWRGSNVTVTNSVEIIQISTKENRASESNR